MSRETEFDDFTPVSADVVRSLKPSSSFKDSPVKHLARKRDGFGFPEYIAYCAVQSALRHYRRSKFYAVALIVPEGRDTNTYYKAAEAFMNPNVTAYRRALNLPILFDSKKSIVSTNEG